MAHKWYQIIINASLHLVKDCLFICMAILPYSNVKAEFAGQILLKNDSFDSSLKPIVHASSK